MIPEQEREKQLQYTAHECANILELDVSATFAKLTEELLNFYQYNQDALIADVKTHAECIVSFIDRYKKIGSNELKPITTNAVLDVLYFYVGKINDEMKKVVEKTDQPATIVDLFERIDEQLQEYLIDEPLNGDKRDFRAFGRSLDDTLPNDGSALHDQFLIQEGLERLLSPLDKQLAGARNVFIDAANEEVNQIFEEESAKPLKKDPEKLN